MDLLTLHIIAKDEIREVENILVKYQQYFDYVDIAVDEKVDEFNKLAKQYEVNVYEYTPRNSFGAINFDDKRNFLASKCKTKYYFRLDTDDEIINPHQIQDVVMAMEKEKVEVICCYYDYGKDEWGTTNAAHYRETIIVNDPNIFWNKHIHENLIPRDGNMVIVHDDRIKLKHNIDQQHSDESVKRNLKYLLTEYEETKDNPDPRTICYLGRSFMGLGQWEKAVFFLEKHIQMSGWNEDRYLSWCQISHIFRILGYMDKSISAAFEALQELPEYPDAYFELHDIYFIQEKYEKAIEWAVMGFTKPIPRTNMITDPSNTTWRPMISLAACYYQTGEFTKAKKLFDKAKTYAPTFEYFRNMEKVYNDAFYHNEYVNRLMWLVQFLKDRDKEKLPQLLNSVPSELSEHEVIAKLKYENLPPKEWQKNEIAIFCGATPNSWSPNSIKEGVGGSEEAVIYLTKELTKLGYKITVFNNCGDEKGNYNNVEYKNIVHFNPRDKFNILISWRSNIFIHKIQASKKIVWVHDLPYNIIDDADFHKTYDNIIVLSKYHASLLPPSVPKEKIYISSNGIVPEDFKDLSQVKRNPKRAIYASSYDRGLEQLLEMWADIRKEVPDAQLDIFYGWGVYDEYVKKGFVKDDGFKARMLELFKQDGVTEHGKVGHKRLLREYAKSKVLAYPCSYSGEINCIALTKAIATGCIALTNDYAVMPERNPHFTCKDDFKERLISVLRGSLTPKYIDIPTYIKENSWEAIAKDWSKNLFPTEVDTLAWHRFEWIHSNINKDETIVDIGSNKGHTFEGWDRTRITSVDIDDYDIPNFVQASADNLPFKDKSFDVGVLAEILEHVDDPVKVLKEAGRVSKRLIVSVPYEYEWVSELKPFNNLDKEMKLRGMTALELAKEANPVKEFHSDDFNYLYHQRFYTPQSLKEDLLKAGFKNVHVIKLRNKEWTWLGATCESRSISKSISSNEVSKTSAKAVYVG